MKNNPIGIFDSGIGGLSILKEVRKILPSESIIYLADSKNCPYGGKTPEDVYVLAKKSLSFLIEQKAKLVVIACNTVTVSCIDKLRQDFPKTPIIGIVPVVKKAAEKSKNKKIGVLSTTTTANSEYQAKLIHQYAAECEITSIGTDELVPLIETGAVNTDVFKGVLERTLAPFKESRIDTLALGCSHFPLVKEIIQNILGDKVLVLDSGGAVARHLKRVLSYENLETSQKFSECEYITTGNLSSFSKTVKEIVGENSGTIRSI